jgi:hypothetical protein
MKTYGGSGRIDPSFLNLGVNWRWVASFTSWQRYPRWNCPRYPMDRKLGGLQSRSGRCPEDSILGVRRPIPWRQTARLLGLRLEPEGGSSAVFRNTCKVLPNYTEWCPRTIVLLTMSRLVVFNLFCSSCWFIIQVIHSPQSVSKIN